MIVRIFRGWMKPEDEDGVHRDFRAGMARGSKPAGLLDIIFARNVAEDGRVELVSISLWIDRKA
jgi:heme-degrading monooxygenase HmoA